MWSVDGSKKIQLCSLMLFLLFIIVILHYSGMGDAQMKSEIYENICDLERHIAVSNNGKRPLAIAARNAELLPFKNEWGTQLQKCVYHRPHHNGER